MTETKQLTATMNENHPITPPPELVEQWEASWRGTKHAHQNYSDYIATQAARWGSDQELEACRGWLLSHGYVLATQELHYARRPEPPSLAEEALNALQNQIDTSFQISPEAQECADLIRRALERLQELENNG